VNTHTNTPTLLCVLQGFLTKNGASCNSITDTHLQKSFGDWRKIKDEDAADRPIVNSVGLSFLPRFAPSIQVCTQGCMKQKNQALFVMPNKRLSMWVCTSYLLKYAGCNCTIRTRVLIHDNPTSCQLRHWNICTLRDFVSMSTTKMFIPHVHNSRTENVWKQVRNCHSSHEGFETCHSCKIKTLYCCTDSRKFDKICWEKRPA